MHLLYESIVVSVLVLLLFGLLLSIEIFDVGLFILLSKISDFLSSGSCLVYFLHDPLFFFHEKVHSILDLLFVIFEAFKTAECLLAYR